MIIILKFKSFSNQTSFIYCYGEVSENHILNFFFNGPFYQIDLILDKYGFGLARYYGGVHPLGICTRGINQILLSR